MPQTARKPEAASSRAMATTATARQTKNQPNEPIATIWRYKGSLAARAINYLWPYQKSRYPGIHSGTKSSLGVFITWQAIQHWMAGRAEMPLWAAEALLDQIRREVEVGRALQEELTEYLANKKPRLRHQSGRLKNRPSDD